MRSPTALLVALVAFVLFFAIATDFSIATWDRFNDAMKSAVGNLTSIGMVVATYAEPEVNPRWAADQIYPTVIFVLWVLILALVVLIAEALRERRGDDDE